MTITKELKEKALEIGRKHKFAKVWVNEAGEVFSDEQYAKASVSADKDKYAAVEITAEVVAKEKKTTELGTAQEVISAIEAAETKEAVQEIIDAETAGKSRVTVLEAGAKKLETIK